MHIEDIAQAKKINKLIDEFSRDPDVLEFIKQTKAGIKTTRHNYGRYYRFLTPYAGDRVSLFIISRACIKAGAEAQGIHDAVSLITGL